jgi:hypothetical protein
MGFALFSLGLVLIFLAPLARFYVTPRVKKIPTDFYFREVATGTGTYLNPGANFAVVGPVPVQNVTIQKGNPQDSTKTVAVWDQFTSLFDTQNKHEITYAIDRLTLRRKDGVSVNCCGQNVNRTGSLTALFPIGTKKESYDFWDSNAMKGYPAAYAGTTTLDGLSVYRFHQHIPALQIKTINLPGKLVGEPDQAAVHLLWMYTTDTDIYVEPVTGGVVRGVQHADQWLTDLTGVRRLTVAKIDAGWDPATIKDAVDTATAQKKQLQLISTGLPVGAPIVGIILIVLAIWLLSRPARRVPATTPDANTEAAPAAG